MPLYLLLGFAFGLMLGYLFLVRKHRSRYFATAEYWVYLPTESMPDQNGLMSRIMERRGIGPSEGLVMSDVRLNIGLVKRSSNPNAFRPDLFADIGTLDADGLEALNASLAFVRLRYTSEEPLPDKRHVRFLVHAAEAVAEMVGGRLIYDSTAERLFSPEELRRSLANDPDATTADLHLRYIWKSSPQGGWAETRGLRKVGRNDLRTYEAETDERILVARVMEEAARQIWTAPDTGDRFQVTAFDDSFQVVIEPAKSGPSRVHILRIQTI